MQKKNDLGQLVHEALELYFQQHGGALPPPGLYKRIIMEIERPLIFLTLKAVSGNQQMAAKILGINRNTLRKKIVTTAKNSESTKALKKITKYF